MNGTEDRNGAVLSPSGPAAEPVYRYALWRVWANNRHTVLFVGLNPSTADAENDDPTIRRCIGFAKAWGFGGLLMGNVYGFRATSPVELDDAPGAGVDPVGPENDYYLQRMALSAGLVVAAWGAHNIPVSRIGRVMGVLGCDVQCLGTTKNGHPRHPLYLRKDTRLEPYEVLSFA